MEDVNSKISSESAASLVYFLVKGSSLGIVTCNIFRLAKTSSYISCILGFIISIIPFLLNIYIIKNLDESSIIDGIENLFGKVLGRIINVLISLILIFFTVFIMYNFVSFVDIEFMPETSKLYITCLLIILFSYMLSKSSKSICKASQIMIYISLIVLFFTVMGTITSIKIENLFPIMEGKADGILSGAIVYAIFSSMPTFLINLIGKKMIADKDNYVRKVALYYILGNLALIIIILLAIMTLGINIVSMNKYPEYILLTQIKLSSILKRVQNLFSLQLCFNVIMLSLMCMLYSLKTVSKFTKNKKNLRLFNFLIPIFVMILSLYIFPNITVANNFYINKLPILFGLVMGVIILIISIRIFIKNKYIENK